METGFEVCQSLLELRDAVGWSDRLAASLIAGLGVIRATINPDIAVIFMLNEDPDILVRVSDAETADRLGSYFETMPTAEHVHAPWLNRELSPVCAADHLDDPAWEQLDPRFRGWYGRNGMVAPIVGDRRHLGAVLLAFGDRSRRMEKAELDFLTLAGRVLGDAVLRIKSADTIRRATAAGERQRVAYSYDGEILSRVEDVALQLAEIPTGQLDDATKASVADVQRDFTELQNVVASHAKDADSGSQLAQGLLSQILPKDLELFSQKWGVRVAFDPHGWDHLDSLPLSTQISLREIVQIALADVRERPSATEATVTLNTDNSRVRLSIVDNGHAQASGVQSSSKRVLAEHVEDLGGSIAMRDLPQRGTQVELRIPTAASGQRAKSMSLLLADPDALFREGLAAIIRQWDEFRVVGRVIDARSVMAETHRLLPDLLIIDVQTDGAMSAIRQLRIQCPHTKIVVLTALEDEQHISSALEAGVCGYLLKGSDPDELRDHLNAAIAGNVVVSARVAEVAENATDRASSSRVRALPNLTKRELDVLTLVANGYSNEEIAGALHVSLSTVKKRIFQLMTKLHVQNRVQLAVYAIRTGIAY